MKKKVIALALGCAVTLGCAIGGTLAWLTDSTNEVQNVFTTSDITVALAETTGDDYRMIPGWTIDKDPVVTVKAGSEDCWVFIEVVESGGEVTVDGTAYSFDDFIAYQIDENNWEQLRDGAQNPVPGVYVGKAPCKDIKVDRAMKVLLNNQVTVDEAVTKEMMNALTADDYPTLTFKAYASQLMKDNETEFASYEAWLNIADPGGAANA
ncbi:MAG: hypothetical protein IJE29_02830 [Firmicutes bacterium]|nr:hypothetical protein [Bacillota bacterium]MBQ3200120.1 hypothetical protein [Bacillota bacterium]